MVGGVVEVVVVGGGAEDCVTVTVGAEVVGTVRAEPDGAVDVWAGAETLPAGLVEAGEELAAGAALACAGRVR